MQQILRKPWVREHAKPIVVLLILMFGLIRPFIVDAYRIPSGSMEDTLLVGDRILVCKFINLPAKTPCFSLRDVGGYCV